MAFTNGQSVRATVNGVDKTGIITRTKVLGSADSYVITFDDGSKKAYFGANITQITAV